MPEQWIYYLFFLVFVMFSSLLFYKACGSLAVKYLNPLSISFYFEIVVCYVGLLIIVVYPDAFQGAFQKATSFQLKYAFWVYSYAMLLLPLIIIIMNQLILNYSPRQHLRIMYHGSLDSQKNKKEIVYFWVIISIICGFCVVYFYLKYPTPWLSLFNSTIYNPKILRGLIAPRNMPFFDSLINRLLLRETAMLASFFLIYYFNFIRNVFYSLWVIFYVALCLLAVAHSGEKSPVVIYLFQLFIAISIKSKKGIKSKHFLLISSALLFLLLIIFYKLMLVKDAQDLFLSFIYRLFIGQIEGFPLSFAVFPIEGDFLGARGLPNWLLPFWGLSERIEASRLRALTCFEFNIFSLQGLGVMNTIYLGDAWAYFGKIGMILSPCVVGFVLGLMYWLIIKKMPTRWRYSLFIYYFFKVGLTAGFMQFLWNPTWGVLAVLFLLEMIFVEIFKVAKIVARRATEVIGDEHFSY